MIKNVPNRNVKLTLSIYANKQIRNIGSIRNATPAEIIDEAKQRQIDYHERIHTINRQRRRYVIVSDGEC